MKQTWLVQRLKRPYKSEGLLAKMDNVFAFGGGYVNGGLSDTAMDLLRNIFRFDYMGSAEFEFGAVPKALSKMADYVVKGEGIAFRIPVHYRYKNWKTTGVESGVKDIYVICNKADELGVIASINSLASNGSRVELKERACVDASLAEAEYDKDTIAWLELDNGFWFTKDKETFDKFCQLFGIKEG